MATTQTATQRKATAQKAAATRRRNAAKRSQSARKAAETRAQAELNTLQVVQAQAERALVEVTRRHVVTNYRRDVCEELYVHRFHLRSSTVFRQSA